MIILHTHKERINKVIFQRHNKSSAHLVLNNGAVVFAFNLTAGMVRIFPMLFVELNDDASDVLCRALVELEELFEPLC